MKKIVSDQPNKSGEEILYDPENVDLIPENIELTRMEGSLVNVIGREIVLKQYLDSMKKEYDFILLDCKTFLGLLTM